MVFEDGLSGFNRAFEWARIEGIDGDCRQPLAECCRLCASVVVQVDFRRPASHFTRLDEVVDCMTDQQKFGDMSTPFSARSTRESGLWCAIVCSKVVARTALIHK